MRRSSQRLCKSFRTREASSKALRVHRGPFKVAKGLHRDVGLERLRVEDLGFRVRRFMGVP